jgi:hypothetical protein
MYGVICEFVATDVSAYRLLYETGRQHSALQHRLSSLALPALAVSAYRFLYETGRQHSALQHRLSSLASPCNPPNIKARQQLSPSGPRTNREENLKSDVIKDLKQFENFV